MYTDVFIKSWTQLYFPMSKEIRDPFVCYEHQCHQWVLKLVLIDKKLFLKRKNNTSTRLETPNNNHYSNFHAFKTCFFVYILNVSYIIKIQNRMHIVFVAMLFDPFNIRSNRIGPICIYNIHIAVLWRHGIFSYLKTFCEVFFLIQ